MSQSRFIHPEFHRFVVDLFNIEVYGNIRRAQGLIRSATKELQAYGREQSGQHIEAAIAQMLLAQAREHKVVHADGAREIVRRPGNPMLRYIRGNHVADDPAYPKREEVEIMHTAVALNLMAEMELLGMFNAFDRLVTDATRDQWSRTDFLDAMLQAESDFRCGRKTKRRIKAAKFALRLTFEDFDFTANRFITGAQIKELYSLH